MRRLDETAWPTSEPGAVDHRTWLVDGTGVSMPDSPALQETYGQPVVDFTPGRATPPR